MALRLFHVARAIESAVRTELPAGASLTTIRFDVPVTDRPSRDPHQFWRLEVTPTKHRLRRIIDRILHRRQHERHHRIRLEWQAGQLTGQALRDTPITPTNHERT